MKKILCTLLLVTAMISAGCGSDPIEKPGNPPASQTTPTKSGPTGTACANDSDCPTNHACVYLGNFAVCAPTCNSDSACGGGEFKQCTNRTKVEDKTKGELVCIDWASIDPESTYPHSAGATHNPKIDTCSKEIKCSDGYECRFKRYFGNDNQMIGKCIKKEQECKESSDCKDPNKPSCVEVQLIDGNYKKVCGTCDDNERGKDIVYGICDAPNEACVRVDKSNMYKCVKTCNNSADCHASTQICNDVSEDDRKDYSIHYKICMDSTANIGYRAPCTNVGPNTCREGLICITQNNGTLTGTCEVPCLTEKDKSDECKYSNFYDCTYGYRIEVGNTTTPPKLYCHTNNIRPHTPPPTLPDYGEKCSKEKPCRHLLSGELVCIKEKETDEEGTCEFSCEYGRLCDSTDAPGAFADGKTKCTIMSHHRKIVEGNQPYYYPTAVCTK